VPRGTFFFLLKEDFWKAQGINLLGDEMMKIPQVVVVIPAAGSGRRMKAGVNKIWLPLNGQTVLENTLAIFQASPLVGMILLVANPSELLEFKNFMIEKRTNFEITMEVVSGGEERQDSVWNALQYLKDWSGWESETRLVAVHDAARPLLTRELFEQSVELALQYQAVGVGVPVKDTIKQVNEELVVTATPKRANLWAIQTPQVFEFELLLKAYQRALTAGERFSDDCSVVEAFGQPVKLMMGSYENFKITTAEDLDCATAIIRRRENADRTGI